MPDADTTRLNDAHCHFFSSGFFTRLAGDPSAPPAADPAVDLPAQLGWDGPGGDDALADRWVVELDRCGVTRAALMASVPGDEASVAAAAARHPARIVGSFMVNPTAPDAAARVQRGFGELRLRCACLFPAMHGFASDDEARLVPDFRSRGRARLRRVRALRRAVGRRPPQARPGVAVRHPARPAAGAGPDCLGVSRVPLIIPHFGAGFFRDTLMAAASCPNIVVDTSSSNAWTQYLTPPPSLADVFRQALAVLGPERILFGSDSSFFPRGWQRPVYDAQYAALEAVGLDATDRAAIFADNFDRVFGSGRIGMDSRDVTAAAAACRRVCWTP